MGKGKEGKEGKEARPALEPIDTTGILVVTEPDKAKKQKYKNVTLKVGEKTYRLLPASNKELFSKLEELSGKTIKVKGSLLPANEKYPLPAIKVEEFSE